jgi:hypothetical protein
VVPGCSQTATRGTAVAGAGLALMVASYAQLLVPQRIYEPPVDRFLGLPLVPVSVLGLSTTLFTLGVILASEGVCLRLGAPSLRHLAVANPMMILYILVAGAVSGVAMEIIGQWLGKLWVYPYWTDWFYALLLVPGFAFYWLSIAQSYLAVKAVLDTLIRHPSRSRGTARSAATLGVAGGLALLASFFLFFHWYAVHGGFTFTITTAARSAPPVTYTVLAFTGLALAAQWVLDRQRRPSPLAGVVNGYWTPFMAVLCTSVILSVVMETQNAAHHYWLYTHFPAPGMVLGGVPMSVFAAWPLQYLIFLLIPSLIRPELADIFWRRH